MKELTQKPDESDTEWRLRITLAFIAMQSAIEMQRREINRLLEGDAEFEMSADNDLPF